MVLSFPISANVELGVFADKINEKIKPTAKYWYQCGGLQEIHN